MEPLVLFAVLALLMFGPRRGGGRPGRVARTFAAVLLVWLVVAWVLGWSLHEIVGDIAQP